MREYGIAFSGTPNTLHRGPMTRREAIDWVTDIETNERLRGVFLVVSREISNWSPHTDGETGFA